MGLCRGVRLGVALALWAAVAQGTTQAQPAGSAGPAGEARKGPGLRVLQPSVRLIDGVPVDVDASALRQSSNVRLVVVPAGSPDAIADPQAFAIESTPIGTTGRVRLTLPGGPAGDDEVRLYHVPRFATAFEVAARAPVTVTPGIAGAVLVRDLGREAARLGPVKFEAKYRDGPVLVQAQFLRVRPQTEWNADWLRGLSVRDLAVVSLGTRAVANEGGSAGEAVCIVATDAAPALRRVAALNPGDAVLVEGRPSTWNAATTLDPILLKDCRIQG